MTGAQIKVSHGVVAIQRDNRSLPGEIGKRLKENDIIVTNADSSVGMTFNDNSMLSLGANSEVVLRRYSYDPTTYIGAFDAVVKRAAFQSRRAISSVNPPTQCVCRRQTPNCRPASPVPMQSAWKGDKHETDITAAQRTVRHRLRTGTLCRDTG
ncbi:MAG: hypothetical protein IPL05_07965 [Betaproteobacteria bacterium]|nr:hypothetical protein [Betaproteobacteria bacterium]